VSFGMKQELAHDAVKGISISSATTLNSTQAPKRPGGLWSFGELPAGTDQLISKWSLLSRLSERQLVLGSATVKVFIQEPIDVPLLKFAVVIDGNF